MTMDERILVDHIDYLSRALQVYQKAIINKKRALQNLFVWTLVKDKTGLLPQKYKDIRLAYDKVFMSKIICEHESRLY